MTATGSRETKMIIGATAVLSDEPIVDRAGRSPSRQLNDPSDLLEKFLMKTMPLSRICRSVVFTQEAAAFGTMQNISVDGVYLMSQWELPSMLQKSALNVTPGDVGRTVIIYLTSSSK